MIRALDVAGVVLCLIAVALLPPDLVPSFAVGAVGVGVLVVAALRERK